MKEKMKTTFMVKKSEGLEHKRMQLMVEETLMKNVQLQNVSHIAGFHMTSWRPCWCTLNKIILIIFFVWDTNMAAMSIVFCVLVREHM